MSRHGGPGAWIIIPYIFSHIPVPKQILKTRVARNPALPEAPEQRAAIQTETGGERTTCEPCACCAGLFRANWNNRGEKPDRLQLMHGSGSAPNAVATGLESAFSSAQCLLVFTSLLQLTNRVAILRTLGKSEVHCLHPVSGEQRTGSLRSALRWESHQQRWFEIWFILKVRHMMVHDAEYNFKRYAQVPPSPQTNLAKMRPDALPASPASHFNHEH